MHEVDTSFISYLIKWFIVENQYIPDSVTDITQDTVMECESYEEIAVPFPNLMGKVPPDDQVSDLGNLSFTKSDLYKY